MGQSQSQIEKNKQRPINPQKIFGLIFLQRSYDNVLQSKKDLIDSKFAAEVERSLNENKVQGGNGKKVESTFEKRWREEFEKLKTEEKGKIIKQHKWIIDYKHYWAYVQQEQSADKNFLRAPNLM